MWPSFISLRHLRDFKSQVGPRRLTERGYGFSNTKCFSGDSASTSSNPRGTSILKSCPKSWACLLEGYQKISGKSYSTRPPHADQIFDCGAKSQLVSIKFHSPLTFARNRNVIIIDTFREKSTALRFRIHPKTGKQ